MLSQIVMKQRVHLMSVRCFAAAPGLADMSITQLKQLGVQNFTQTKVFDYG